MLPSCLSTACSAKIKRVPPRTREGPVKVGITPVRDLGKPELHLLSLYFYRFLTFKKSIICGCYFAPRTAAISKNVMNLVSCKLRELKVNQIEQRVNSIGFRYIYMRIADVFLTFRELPRGPAEVNGMSGYSISKPQTGTLILPRVLY